MINIATTRATIAGLLVAATLGGVALAAGTDADTEATALQRAKLTLTEGIATAERQTGGQAYDAGVRTDGGRVHIVVETNGPKGVQTVSIDAETGRILGTHDGGEPD